jgi:hypothetical protein
MGKETRLGSESRFEFNFSGCAFANKAVLRKPGSRPSPNQIGAIESRRSASIGGTGGASAGRQRREQERTPEASARSVHASGIAVMKEAAERRSRGGKHGYGRAATRWPAKRPARSVAA